MIDIVTGSKNFSRLAGVEAMYRLRHRVFKERLDWDVSSDGEREIDSYDREDTKYLLAYDTNEHLVGSWRLLPTTRPYMLRDTFPELLDEHTAPCSPVIWEASRFAVTGAGPNEQPQGAGPGIPNQITRELFLGLVEYCISQGIESIYTVYDVRIARLLPHIGCKPFWQSRLKKIGQTTTLAGAFATNHAVLTEIRARAGITHSVIRSVPWSTSLEAA